MGGVAVAVMVTVAVGAAKVGGVITKVIAGVGRTVTADTVTV